MEKLLKIKLLFAVAVVYVMVAGGFSSAINQQPNEVNTSETVAMQHKLSFNDRYFSGYALHESGLTTSSTAPLFSFAKQWEVFKAVIQASEERVLKALAQTIEAVILFPVRIRKADLLFPFHYFF